MAQIEQGGDSLASIIAILNGLYLPLAGGTMVENARVNHGNSNSYRVAGAAFIQDIVNNAMLPISSTQSQSDTTMLNEFNLFGTNNSFFGQSAQQETSYISDSVSNTSETTQLSSQKITTLNNFGGFNLIETLIPTTRTTRAEETLFNTQYAESIVNYAYQIKTVTSGTLGTRYSQDLGGFTMLSTSASGTSSINVTSAGGLVINAKFKYTKIQNIAAAYNANRADSVIIATPPAGNYSISLYESLLQTGSILIIRTNDLNVGTVSITPFAGETIRNSGAAIVLGPNSSITLMSNGTNWEII